MTTNEMKGLDAEKVFTDEEGLLLRTLVHDRIENRFDMARRGAEGMDIVLLKGCVDELCRLDALALKIKEVTG